MGYEELKIEYLSPADLTPYENNTRRHNPEDIEGIKKSILDVGFADPIGIWGKNNLIVEGHGRQLAALELGLEKVPVIRLDHMTEAQRKEYAIRHNRSAEMSAWDFGKLEEELAGLEIDGVDMADLNFDFNQGDLFGFMNNDAFSEKNNNPDTFTMSFEFDVADKDDLTDYIKKNGKSGIVEKILEVVKDA